MSVTLRHSHRHSPRSKSIISLPPFIEKRYSCSTKADIGEEARLHVFHESNTETDVDIVAVQGLEIDPLKAWAIDDVLWLRDFLPSDVPHTRIMSFGYQFGLALGCPLDCMIKELAEKLLQQVSAKRVSLDEKKRPLVFVGYSLGGWLIKQALVLASNDPRFQSLFTATYAILFLGTPHQGSNNASLPEILAKIIQLMSPRNAKQRKLGLLRSAAGQLASLQAEFSLLASALEVVSFYESKRTSTRMLSRGYLSRTKFMLVDEESVKTDITTDLVLPLNGAHEQICRFKNRDDVSYCRVAHYLLSYVQAAPQAVARRSGRCNAIPFESPFYACTTFIGRLSTLTRMRQFFTQCSMVSVQPRQLVLRGPDGVGKSQMALKYATLHRKLYDASVFWIDARTKETISDSFQKVANLVKFNLRGEDDIVSTVASFLFTKYIEEKALVVFDGMDTSEGLRELRLLAKGTQGNIIVTSQLTTGLDSTSMEIIELTGLEQEDAVELLADQLNDIVAPEDKDKVVDVSKELRCLPLAVGLAGSFMKMTSCAPSEFLKLLRSQREDVMRRNSWTPSSRYTDDDEALHVSFEIVFKHIQIFHPVAAQLLANLCFMEHTAIPELLLHRGCKIHDEDGERLPQLLRLLKKPNVQLKQTLEWLIGFGLVQRWRGSLSVHPMVVSKVRKWTSDSSELVRETIYIVANAFPKPKSTDCADISVVFMNQVFHCCRIAESLEPDCDVAELFVCLCLDAFWVGVKRRKLLAVCERFLPAMPTPYLRLCHVEGTVKTLLEGGASHELALRLLARTRIEVATVATRAPLTKVENAKLGILITQEAGLLALKGQVGTANLIIRDWEPQDRRSLSRDERSTLDYRDRVWGRNLYLQRRMEEAVRVLQPLVDRGASGERSWAIAHLSDVYCAQYRFQSVADMVFRELKILEVDTFCSAAPSRLKINLCEVLIEMGRFAEAEEVSEDLCNLLASIKSKEPWALRELFLARTCLARTSHQRQRWEEASERWRLALECAAEMGRPIDRFPANLVAFSIADLNWELGQGCPAVSMEQWCEQLAFEMRKGCIERTAFTHWPAFLLQKVRKRTQTEVAGVGMHMG